MLACFYFWALTNTLRDEILAFYIYTYFLTVLLNSVHVITRIYLLYLFFFFLFRNCVNTFHSSLDTFRVKEQHGNISNTESFLEASILRYSYSALRIISFSFFNVNLFFFYSRYCKKESVVKVDSLDGWPFFVASQWQSRSLF